MSKFLHANKKSIVAALLLILFILLTLSQRLMNSMGYFSVSEVAWFSFAVIAISLCGYMVFFFFQKDAVKAALFSILVAYLFFNAHHLFSIFETKISSYEYFAVDLYVKILALSLLLILSFVIFIATYRSMKKFRNVTVKFFILYLILSILSQIYLAYNHRTGHAKEELAVEGNLNPDHSNGPDIYYIILDSFTSLNSLQKFWNYSDKSLELILDQKNINYSFSGHTKFATTPECMASYLNMCWEQTTKNEEVRNMYQSLKHIRHNAAVSFLQRNHYQVKNLSLFKTGGEENFFTYFPEVSIWGNTLPYLLFRLDRKLNHPRSEIEVNFNIAKEIIAQSQVNRNNPEPVFTYAHLMLPHSRYLLDSAGFLQKNNQLPEKQRYLAQLQFARKAMVYFFTTIIKNDPGAVINVQGDHGYRGLDNRKDRKTEAFTMFNAIYLSGERLSGDTLACLNNPVNNFGIVLNKYFGSNIKMLPE